MSEHNEPTFSAVHGSFSIERVFAAFPHRVFQAFADPAAKALWFGGDKIDTVLEQRMEVRPGGSERLKVRWESGLVTQFEATYFDVVPNARLVYTYEMHLDGKKISISLATLQFLPDAGGTYLKVTEQGAFLDGYEDAGAREHGTGFLLERLRASFES